MLAEQVYNFLLMEKNPHFLKLGINPTQSSQQF